MFNPRIIFGLLVTTRKQFLMYYTFHPENHLGHRCITESVSFYLNADDMHFKSYLWSKPKKRWLPGPDVGDFSYDNACGVSLNTTSVLIIGAAKGPYMLINDHIETLIYNFELKTLMHQQSLPRVFKGTPYEWYWSAKTTCTVFHSKNSSR